MNKYPTIDDKRAIYNHYAKFYEQRTRDYTQFLSFDYDLFLRSMVGKRILDLGAGPGRDSSIFLERGFSPTAYDISQSMLEICQAKGISTFCADIEQLSLPTESFNGVWSHVSLTTIPKVKVWWILNRVHTILRKDGVFFLGLIEGEGEGWKPPDKKYHIPRYVSRYQTAEVINQLDPQFELLYFRKISKAANGRNTYLNFLWRKRRYKSHAGLNQGLLSDHPDVNSQ